MAYQTATTPRAIPRALLPIFDRVMIALLRLRRRNRAVGRTAHALAALTDAVLDATERDSPDYRADTLKAVTSGTKIGTRERMTPEGFRDWLSKIPHRTDR